MIKLNPNYFGVAWLGCCCFKVFQITFCFPNPQNFNLFCNIGGFWTKFFWLFLFGQHFFGSNILWNVMGTIIVLGQALFGIKSFWEQNFWSQFFRDKDFLGTKYFWSKNFLGSIFLAVTKNFGPNTFRPNKVF